MEAFTAWATNNWTYHTLEQCFAGDWTVISLVLLLTAVIVVGYVQIGLDALKQIRLAQKKDRELATNLSYFVGVFLFCALAGYAWRYVELVFPAQRLYVVILSVLALFTWSFIYQSRRTNFFARLLNNVE